LEGTVAFNENLSLRAQATFQNSKAIEYKTWISSGVNASQDVLLDFSGNRNRQQCTSHVWSYADVSKGKFNTSFNYYYMGSRQANIPNAFKMPAFGQLDWSVEYDVNPKLRLQEISIT
jgi:hypothetical protein